MKRWRISVAGLMAAVVYLGFAFAALTRPTSLWSEGWLSALLALLAVAVLGAVYGQKGRREFWGGFALVGGGYIALTLFPANAPRLFPDRLIEGYYRTLSYSPESAGEPVWVLSQEEYYEGQTREPLTGGSCSVSFTTPTGTILAIMPPTNLRALGPDAYRRLYHAILAPLLGVVGGQVARGFANRIP